jgi:hypothetical protein
MNKQLTAQLAASTFAASSLGTECEEAGAVQQQASSVSAS